MMNIAFFRIITLYIGCLFVTAGQLTAGETPTVKYVGIEHGLSNNSVLCVYQDYKGFMWFGTYDGLNRYDGYDFTIFRNRIGDATSLNCNEVFSIIGDAQHNLWIGARKGISIYDPVKNNFSVPLYFPFGEKTAKPVTGASTNIVIDSLGHVFAPTDKDGFIVFDNKTHVGKQIPLQTKTGLTSNYRVMTIEGDNATHGAWLIIQNVGLCRYDEKANVIKIANNSITDGNCLREDGKGNIWMGTEDGLYLYNAGSNTFSENYLQGNFKITCIRIDKKGVLWIGSDGRGILQITAPGNKATPYLSTEGKSLINSVAVYSIYEDMQGRKWVGTLRGGVNIIESKIFPFKSVVYGDEKILNSNKNFIQAFCEDEKQNLWIGTGGGGIRYWDRKQNTYREYTYDAGNKNSVGGNFITGILRDAQNDIWVSSWFGGISKYNKATDAFERYHCFNPYLNTIETRAWFVYEDRQKRLWASTSNDGTLFYLDRQANEFKILDSSLQNLQCITQDKAGNLWAGNYGSLIKIDPVNKQHQYYKIGYTIRSIHEDSNGNFWVATQGGGLLLFDRKTGTYKRYDESEGLIGNTILRILEDKKGNLWMSSFTGLIKMNITDKKFIYFSKSDGLQSNQFNFNAAIKLQSGEFLFGGLKGFNIFYPDSVRGQGSSPAVYLTSIRVGGQPLDANSSFIRTRVMENIKVLRVPYDSSTLSFDFVALEYSFPDKIKYAYYLDGWDKNWNYTGAIKTANYNHINEGSYLLRIKSTNADGSWSNNETTIKIIVLPPWYRTWWAYLSYMLILSGAIYLYLFYKDRQSKLKYEIQLAHIEAQKEKELNERKVAFFTNISHEFRTPLSLIINPIKDILHKNSQESENNELSIVYRNAKRLLRLVDQLLLFKKSDSEMDKLNVARLNIYSLCKEVYMCFIQQARAKKIFYEFNCGNKKIEIFADREKLEIALFNILSNAFKNTPDNGKVIFKLEELNDTVQISIADNGRGIPVEAGEKLFERFYQVKKDTIPSDGFGIGLYLVKKFIDAHQGKISYETGQGQGTTFFINLKKGGTHINDSDILKSSKSESVILQELNETELEKRPVPVSKKPGQVTDIITDQPTILIIDDDDEMRSYLISLFDADYKIYNTNNGSNGISLAHEHLPDLILCDVMMEGVDGIDLCKTLKTDTTVSHIPIILLTGTSSDEIQLKGFESGADDYIKKPFDKDILLARVENMLKSRNTLQNYFFNEVTLQTNTFKISAEYKEFLEKCIKIVEDHMDDENFSIKILASEIGMSHSTLYKKVKSVSGQSVNSFIRFIRLRKAAEIFINTESNVNETAAQVGFNDVKYFREQFFKLFNLNPSEYIKKYRKPFHNIHQLNENMRK